MLFRSLSQLRYYGPSQVVPSNTEYQPLALTFICRADSQERRFFDDWLDFINPITSFNFQYPEDYYCNIEIYQYQERGGQGGRGVPQISYHWKLHKAWPTLVNDQAVNWAESEYLRLQVSFAYKYWSRPNLKEPT